MARSQIAYIEEPGVLGSTAISGVQVYDVFSSPLGDGDGVIFFTTRYILNASYNTPPHLIDGDAENLVIGCESFSDDSGLKLDVWYIPQAGAGAGGVTFTTGLTLAGVNDVVAMKAIVVKNLEIELVPEDVGNFGNGTNGTTITPSVQPTDLSNLVVTAIAYEKTGSTVGTPNIPFLGLTTIGGEGPVSGFGSFLDIAVAIQNTKTPQIATRTLSPAQPWLSGSFVLGGTLLDTSRIEVDPLNIQTYNTLKPQPDEVWLLADRTFEASTGEVVLGGPQVPAVQKVPIIEDTDGRLIAGGFTGDNAILPNRIGTTGLCSLYSLWLARGGKKTFPLGDQYQNMVIPDTITPTSWQAIVEYNKDL